MTLFYILTGLAFALGWLAVTPETYGLAKLETKNDL